MSDLEALRRRHRQPRAPESFKNGSATNQTTPGSTAIAQSSARRWLTMEKRQVWAKETYKASPRLVKVATMATAVVRPALLRFLGNMKM